MQELEPDCPDPALGSDRTRPCVDEVEVLIDLSARAIVDLTGPSFPYLAPKDAGRALLLAAVAMPEHLRLRTLRVAVDLLHSGDWTVGIGTAALHGDPVGVALELLLAWQELGATGVMPEGRFRH